MAGLLITVTGSSLTQVVTFNDSIYLSGLVQAEGAAAAYSWAFTHPVNDSADAVVDAIIATAITTINGHGGSYTTADEMQLIGGPAREPPTDDDTGLCSVPVAASTVSLSSGTPRQPSATRPVMVSITGSWSWNLTALGTQTGSLTLKSDAAATPTTVISAPAWSRAVTVGIAVGDAGTVPAFVSYLVPPGHYYSVTAAGGATFSIMEQAL